MDGCPQAVMSRPSYESEDLTKPPTQLPINLKVLSRLLSMRYKKRLAQY